ncbi:ABC transporter permease [Arsenicicoccus piscis]|uniref:ABC transporter n=1 Tax=Arsenicicoccus piscis TaxID=673954 RepID=A0ABQ6HRS8_9MICO|nr:FtsX-like permease family protein [Arsenicicoccus piscis]GMA20732.1 ABC transporter [Arsenicicoccus piscis]
MQSAYGSITDQTTYLIGKDGKVLASQGPPSLGMNVIDAPAFGHQPGLVIKSGRAPTAWGEVAIDPGSLTRSGYQLGDTMKIATTGKEATISAKIVGTALYGSQASTGGATYAVFDTKTAQRLFLGGKDAYMGLWVTADQGQDVDQLATAVGQVLPSDLEAVTGEKLADEINKVVGQATGFITIFLLVFAGIALVVGSFLIVNTFSILVAQRSRELALFRALGASRAQVRRSVLFEALVMGLVGSTLGLLAGVGIALAITAIFKQIGLDVGGAGISLAPRTILASYLVGLLVTMAAAYFPARRASSVPPVAAMTGDAMTGKNETGRRVALGSVLAALGFAALLTGLFWSGAANRVTWIGLGALGALLGVAALSPLLGRPLTWALGRFYRKAFGTVGQLAELNADRNPRRTAATASALMIGLTLVTAMAVLGNTAKVSTHDAISKNLRADYLASGVSYAGFSTTVGDEMAKVPGVASVHRLRFVQGAFDGQRATLRAIDPGGFDKIVAQQLQAGSAADFTKDTVIVDAQEATDKGYAVGSTQQLTVNGRTVPVKVVGISAKSEDGGGIGGTLITTDTAAALGAPAVDNLVAVDRASGADPAAVRSALDATVKNLPMVTVTDQQEYADQQAAGIDQLLALIYGLLGLAIVIAILGIVNTLALSVIERTREIGLLRAIGLGRGQLRRMIRLESVIIALLGSVLGVLLGLLFGFALQRSLADQGLTALAIPWAQLAAFLVLAVIVGILAALWPAMRAARLDVLRAITTE